MKKRFLSILLVLCMSISLLSGISFAASAIESGTCGDNLTWTLDSEGVLTVSGTGAMKDYERVGLEGTLDEPLDGISESSMVSAKTLIIEEGVTSIGWYAFMGFSGLTSITIPDGVETIAVCAFADCSSLTRITIPDSVKSIGSGAFGGCESLTDVYYTGDQAKWSQITIGDFNESLTSATIHFNADSKQEEAEQEQPEAPIEEQETPVVTAPKFSDVAVGAWYHDSVNSAVELGLMNGTSETNFNPNGTVTRGMVMTVLARLAGADTEGGAAWYEKGMTWAKENGVSDGTNPTGTITREQLATMLYRYAGSPESDATLSAYNDASAISTYAADAMAWAVDTGLINGTSATTLNPKGTATRAQLAAILVRFSESVTE